MELCDDNGKNVGIGNGTNAHPTTVKLGKKLPGLAQIVYKKALYLLEASISKNFFDVDDLSQSFSGRWPAQMIQFQLTLSQPMYLPQTYYLCWLSSNDPPLSATGSVSSIRCQIYL